jgi:anti-sigma regulatory factor (Ser/Thr protein kinase)
MCRFVSTVLPCDRRSAGQARAWTDAWLGSWDVDDDGATTLLVSELVTNAVVHARRTSVITLAVAAGMIEVGVTELGSSRSTIPEQRDVVVPGVPEVLRESGRGLLIVEALSHDWGAVSADGGGKQVWFRRPAAGQWPYSAVCACGTDSPTAHRLPSGHGAVAVPGPWDRLPG